MSAGASGAFEVWRRPPKASPQTTPTSAGELCVRETCRRHTTGGKKDCTWEKRNPKQRPRHNSVAFMAHARRFCHGTI